MHAGPACRFFLSDIYAPRDFSQRDHEGIFIIVGMGWYLLSKRGSESVAQQLEVGRL